MQGNLGEAIKYADRVLTLAKKNKGQWQQAIATHPGSLKLGI